MRQFSSQLPCRYGDRSHTMPNSCWPADQCAVSVSVCSQHVMARTANDDERVYRNVGGPIDGLRNWPNNRSATTSYPRYAYLTLRPNTPSVDDVCVIASIFYWQILWNTDKCCTWLTSLACIASPSDAKMREFKCKRATFHSTEMCWHIEHIHQHRPRTLDFIGSDKSLGWMTVSYEFLM